MTCTVIVAMAICAFAPADDPQFNKFTAIFHDPVIAPYSELILFHASIETQPMNHSLWLLGDGGRAKRIASEVVVPVCLGVLPNDPVAIVTDHGGTSEAYKLVSLRTGVVVAAVPTFDLRVSRALTDQFNKTMLLVARDTVGALGLYTFAVNDWYRATGEGRDAIRPRKVWSLESDPVDLVFSRDGGRVAMLKGHDLQILTIGDEVTSRTLIFPGTVVHPRDFHPSKDVLLYEATAVMPLYGNTLGEVGVLNIGTGARRAALYYAEDTEPDKNPRFDSSGAHLFVNGYGEGAGTPEGELWSGRNLYTQVPAPTAFPIDLSRPQVSLKLFDWLIYGKDPHSLGPLFVTRSHDQAFRKVASGIGELRGGNAFNIHSGWAAGSSNKQSHYTSRDGSQVDFAMKWSFTAAFSPTAPGMYVSVSSAAIVGETGSPYTWNSGTIERFDASKPPAYRKRGDLVERGGDSTIQFRETQGDILLDTDVTVFNEPDDDYLWWALHYPNWSHYGP